MSVTIIKNTYSSLKYSFVYKILEQGSIFFLSIILARILSPEEFGVIALANFVFNYANNFTNMGLNNALVQSRNYNEKQLNSVFTIDFVISFILMISLFVFSNEISAYFNNEKLKPVLKLMSIYFVITTFHSTPLVILRREINFKFISIAEYLQSIFLYIISITLAYLGYSYWSLIIPMIGLSLLFSILFMIKTRWIPKLRYNHSIMKGIYNFGVWSFIRAQLSMLVSSVDLFVIGKYLPIKDLGIYDKSFSLTERSVKGITMPLNTVLFSSFSRLQEDSVAQKTVFLNALKILLLILVPSIFGFIALAPNFVLTLLGVKWTGAIIPIQILAGSLFFKLPGGTIASLNIANGNFKVQTLCELGTTVCLITLCFMLVQYGILAICIAVLIYSGLNFLFGLFILKKYLMIKLTEVFKTFVYPIGVSTIMIMVVLSFSENIFMDQSSIVHFLSLVIIGIIVYALIVFFLYKKRYLIFNW